MPTPDELMALGGKTVEGVLKDLGISEKKATRMVRGISQTPSGLKVMKEGSFGERHKLSMEDRAQRRADNKAMKKIRQTNRKRRKHGR